MSRQVSPDSNIYNPTNGMRPQLVSSYRHVVLQVVVTSSGAPGDKLIFEGSAQEQPVPDFTLASSQTNFHTPVQVINLDDGSSVDGTIGFPLTSTGSYLFEVNTNLISWIGLNIASIGGAVFTVDILASED